MTWSAARGHVFLFDLEARQRVSAWTLPGCERGFSDAAGVAMDEHFHLFVADPHNGRVRHFSVFGRHLGDIGTPPPERGDSGRDRPGVLDRPHAVAVRGDRLYVAAGDQPRRFAVQRFTLDGRLVGTLRAGGDVEQRFGAPRGIWADGDGTVVADTQRGRLQRFRVDGTFLAEVPLAARDVIARPIAVARRPDGSMLVVDAGDQAGCALFAPDGRPLAVPTDLADRCERCLAVTLDDRGRAYVLDRHGERVQRFTAELRFDGVIIDLAEHVDYRS